MILITRPKEQSKKLKFKLTARGYKIFQESFYHFKYYKKNVSFNDNNYYLFPSIHSVNSLKKSKQLTNFKNAKILVIGRHVSTELANEGCKNILATYKDSNALLKYLKSSKIKSNRFIYFCSNIVNEDFLVEAKSCNINIKKTIVYKTIATKNFTNELMNSFILGKISAVTFYSKLSVETFIKLTSELKISKKIKKLPMYCISDRVAKPLLKKKFSHVYISNQPNEKSFIASIKKVHFYSRS